MTLARDLDPNEAMPRNVLAERALIGYLLWTAAEDDAAFPDFCADLTPEDFYDRECRSAWAAIRRVEKHRGILDVILLSDEAGVSCNWLFKCMAPWFASRRHVEHYAAIVREHSQRRQQIREGMQQMQEGLSGNATRSARQRRALGGFKV